MRFRIKRPDMTGARWIFVLAVLMMTGCTTPPSVAPLLRITERALHEESLRIQDDTRRDSERMRGALESLEEGFNRDLEQKETLTPDWVREATTVYIAAREMVVSHQNALTQDRIIRADNLAAAASATRRAISLIEGQDRLFDGVMDEDLRRLLSVTDWNPREPGR